MKIIREGRGTRRSMKKFIKKLIFSPGKQLMCSLKKSIQVILFKLIQMKEFPLIQYVCLRLISLVLLLLELIKLMGKLIGKLGSLFYQFKRSCSIIKILEFSDSVKLYVNCQVIKFMNSMVLSFIQKNKTIQLKSKNN